MIKQNITIMLHFNIKLSGISTCFLKKMLSKYLLIGGFVYIGGRDYFYKYFQPASWLRG